MGHPHLIDSVRRDNSTSPPGVNRIFPPAPIFFGRGGFEEYRKESGFRGDFGGAGRAPGTCPPKNPVFHAVFPNSGREGGNRVHAGSQPGKPVFRPLRAKNNAGAVLTGPAPAETMTPRHNRDSPGSLVPPPPPSACAAGNDPSKRIGNAVKQHANPAPRHEGKFEFIAVTCGTASASRHVP